MPHGVVRATVLIETITAAFEMEEILHALRDHVAGLNAGRWDYLFSIIKNFRDAGPTYTLPDRGAVTMTAPMMQAYSDLLVATCHRRGAFAIGGMAAFIPSRRDAEANERAFAKVREDKTREASAGFDGSWVAHPDLVPVCAEIFGGVLGDRPNQADRQRDDVHVAAAQLLAVGETPGVRTEQGLRDNISIGITYLHAWLSGNGAAAIRNLMEDAATAEISRSQVWQWVWNGATLDTGEVITRDAVEQLVEQEYAGLVQDVDAGRPPAVGDRPQAVRRVRARRGVRRLPDPAGLPGGAGARAGLTRGAGSQSPCSAGRGRTPVKVSAIASAVSIGAGPSSCDSSASRSTHTASIRPDSSAGKPERSSAKANSSSSNSTRPSSAQPKRTCASMFDRATAARRPTAESAASVATLGSW